MASAYGNGLLLPLTLTMLQEIQRLGSGAPCTSKSGADLWNAPRASLGRYAAECLKPAPQEH